MDWLDWTRYVKGPISCVFTLSQEPKILKHKKVMINVLIVKKVEWKVYENKKKLIIKRETLNVLDEKIYILLNTKW